jgi:CheY-like chemotaxis protein
MSHFRSQKLSVLLAEDEALVRMLFERALRSLGCDVICARDGREAIELLKDHSFDLIVLDWNMPEKNGWMVAETARDLGVLAPIVLISGNSDVLSLPNPKGVVNGIFLKPFLKTDFQRLLNHFFHEDSDVAENDSVFVDDLPVLNARN